MHHHENQPFIGSHMIPACSDALSKCKREVAGLRETYNPRCCSRIIVIDSLASDVGEGTCFPPKSLW